MTIVLIDKNDVKNDITEQGLGPFTYKCHICGKKMKNLCGWALHEVSHIYKELECPICGEKCTIHGLEKHVRGHSDEELFTIL